MAASKGAAPRANSAATFMPKDPRRLAPRTSCANCAGSGSPSSPNSTLFADARLRQSSVCCRHRLTASSRSTGRTPKATRVARSRSQRPTRPVTGKIRTGARRLVPISCSSIRIDLIGENRLQWFAEARQLHAKGATWWEFQPALRKPRRNGSTLTHRTTRCAATWRMAGQPDSTNKAGAVAG
jgi:hypothetical protein